MTRKRNRLVSLLLAAALLLTAASASALSRADIYNYLESGLAPEVIVSIVRGTTEPVRITEQEVLQMRSEGVPEPILQEVCSRIGCSSAAAPGAAPAPGTAPSLDAERERQRQEEEARQAAERERIQRDMAAADARQARPDPSATALARGERLYRDGAYLRSARTYGDFMETAREGSDEYNTALFGFVRGMYAAGSRYAIRGDVLDLVELGPSSPHFEESFDMLVEVARATNYQSPRIENLTAVTVGTMSDSFQARWNFFLGRFFWVYGESTRALEFFGRVADSAPERPRAHYLAATIYLDMQQNANAVREMERAVLAAIRTNNPEVEELAYLALARVTYEIGNFDAALYYYNKIPQSSFRTPRVLFEKSWAHFLNQNFTRAVGSLHALHSPYYRRFFWPDLWVMEAAMYHQTCNLEEAEYALEMFNQRVLPLQRPVQEFIATTQTPQEYYDAIMNYHARVGTSDPVQLPIEAVRYVLSRPEFHSQYVVIRRLQEERDLHAANRAQIGEELADFFVESIEADLLGREIDTGLRISALLLEFDRELSDWGVRAQEVGIEVSGDLITLTRQQLAGTDIAGEGATTTFVLARDWQTWPFDGEFWLDELDAYRGDFIDYRDADTGACILPVPEAE